MTSPAAILNTLRRRLAAMGDSGRHHVPFLQRVPPVHDLLELAARVGYAARGFVYLSVGVIGLLAAFGRTGDAVGTSGAVAWLAEQPFGRVWLVALGLGLWAFVMWRVLQSVFDADHEGTSRQALMLRAGQMMSGLFYGLLAATVFEVLDEVGRNPASDDVAENQDKAAMLLALPFGDWLLIAAGLVILCVGASNVIRGVREDFTEVLACSPKVCRRVAPIAKAGYVARGLAYLPLAAFVILAGIRSRASEVRDFGSALDALETYPGGSWVLALTALGLTAFGAFAFVEARFRRIRPPRDLNPLT